MRITADAIAQVLSDLETLVAILDLGDISMGSLDNEMAPFASDTTMVAAAEVDPKSPHWTRYL
jgi:hypothetical protein